MVSISRSAKKDLKKGFGYIIKTALALSMTPVTILLINILPEQWVSFGIGIYTAFVVVALILIDKNLGTFTTAELEGARGIMKDTITESTKNIEAVDTQEMDDMIEAKKRNIPLTQLKQEKYGDPEYDYGKGVKAEQERVNRLAELQKEMELLQAQAPRPPAPEIPKEAEPTTVIETPEELTTT